MTTDPAPHDDWIDTAEAARRSGLQPHQLRHAAETGVLPARRVAGRLHYDPTGLADLIIDRNTWISYAAAAELVGCCTGTITRAVHAGQIASRHLPRRPSLDLASVLRFREHRLAQLRQQAEQVAARRAAAQQRQEDAGPPDAKHHWLTTTQAAQKLGLSRTRVAALAAQDRVPHRRHGGKNWLRADHVQLIVNARTASQTRTIPPE